MRIHGAKVLGISAAMMLATFVAPTTRAGDLDAGAVMTGVGNLLGGIGEAARGMNGVPQNVYIKNGYSGYPPMYPNPYVTTPIIYNPGYVQPQPYIQPPQPYYQPQPYIQPAQPYIQPQPYVQPAQPYYPYAQPAQPYYQPQQHLLVVYPG